jgi:TonB-dependent SusC/RagA subfamily outer membrane receptor
MRIFHIDRRLRLLAPVLLVALTGCGTSPTHDSRYGPEPNRRVSANTVTQEQISNFPTAATVEEVITSHVPGVHIGRRGDGTVGLIIAGLGTMGRNTAQGPLVVIDGVPTASRGMIGVNPRDVSLISVLKDGASLAMYGLRGTAGVIVINTRRN